MNYIIYKDESALYYECGYSCDNGIFVQLGNESFFITDGRYQIDANESIKDSKIIITNSLVEDLAKLLRSSKIKKITIDPSQWTLHAFNLLKESTPTKFKMLINFSHKKRIIKSSREIEYLQRAVKLGKKAFKSLEKKIESGMSEKELNFLAESILRDFGNRELSFDPILAIDESASKPHALPTKKILNSGSLILFDAGVKYKRYCSDRTRTAYFDNNLHFSYKQKFKSKKIQKAYDLVLKAHDKAISKARVGMRASEIDKIARDIIVKGGYEKEFVHSTGHGVGLDIHEMPYISKRDNSIIEDGMVFTVEPGIYVDGKFGIRVEDMIVMQNGRAKVL